ncbi:sulfatase [Marinoscillum sp. MHG1-6]|uniref:sulfatase n=1 Tax=Marinoscillum sp. MHG1-6 TaxID=2959627 RepID=UPI002157C4B4|nr:sulfatase [Marinoscillum sp. MHG1-6]
MKTYRTIFIALLILGIILPTTLFGNGSNPIKKKKQPNVVFFLVDDLGWKDVSYAGSPLYETPNIDAAAKRGVIFTQAYAAHPRCVPSRYAMITGKYPARIQCPGPGEGALKDEERTMAEPFKEAGYTTFFAGKWHLSSAESYPDTQGFDYNYGGGHAGAPKSYFYPYNTQTSGKGNGHEKDILNLDDVEAGKYLSDHLTDKTVSFIQNHKDTPFFIYLAHYGVHTPFEAKEEKVKAYQKKVKDLYGDEEVPEVSHENWTGDTKLRQDNPVYAGMIESIDESFGRVMAELEAQGIADNTIIVFTSDHGGLSNRGNGRRLATSNLPLRAGKGHNYEGGIKVPMFVTWANGIKPGNSNTLVTGTDYFPTLLDLCGLPPEESAHLDGVSFAPSLLKGKTQNTDRPVFWHSPVPRPTSTGDQSNTSVRLGDFKLLDFYEFNKVELYNLADDPEEQNNLSDSMPEKRDELITIINNWRTEVVAYMGKPNKVDKKKKGKKKKDIQ